MFDIGPVNDFFDYLLTLSGDPIFLFAAFTIALLDSVIPVVPSETMLIVGGVAAGAGQQRLRVRDPGGGAGRVRR